MNYYNDSDPKVCAWARELVRAGLVPAGEVDCRPIQEVTPGDLAGFTQCHFFCGIVGWPYALRLAGWPEDEPVWTGSCPCQPFSAAGKQLGTADPRHLWPEFRRLVAECAPSVVFGEQVASKAGREWLAGVCADLEALGYAVGAADLCAASAGAPHIRPRLFWVADVFEPELEGYAGNGDHGHESRRIDADEAGSVATSGSTSGVVLTNGSGSQPGRQAATSLGHWNTVESAGSWSNFDILPCRDGKARRVESGTFPLAHGVPGRVGLLRGYGNAIVPQVAAEFIGAYLDAHAG